MPVSPYPFLLLAGVAVSLGMWRRLARRDSRLLGIYGAALVGAFFGAKVVYLAAEGWMWWGDARRWEILLTGKSILGALLGGYAGVEVAKRGVGYREATGDLFAVVAPVGILLGRVGCLLHGCCLGEVCRVERWWTLRDALGVPRWPAVPVEMGFNLAALGVALALGEGERRKGKGERGAGGSGGVRPPPLSPGRRSETAATGGVAGAVSPFAGRLSPFLPGQHFHLYLMAYGGFRFAHEFWRATPRVGGSGLTGYQAAALAVFALGLGGFLRRQRSRGAGGAIGCRP